MEAHIINIEAIYDLHLFLKVVQKSEKNQTIDIL